MDLAVYITMRSPYSYLVLHRVAYLQSQYNVDITVKVVFPNAVRTQSEDGKSSVFGRWYYGAYSVVDQPRTALYQGVPFRWAHPDPISKIPTHRKRLLALSLQWNSNPTLFG